MINFQVDTYWNVDTLFQTLNGVASIMGASKFESITKMVLVLGIVLGIFVYNGSKSLELFKWFVTSLIFLTVLNLPIARVTIVDKTAQQGTMSVDNVPFALAVVAETASKVTGWLTDTYETVFSVPEELALGKGDLAFGHRILRSVNRASIADPALRADLLQYFKECTLYDIRDKQIDYDDVISGTTGWSVVLDPSKTNPARFVAYGALSGASATKTCPEAATLLDGRVNAGLAASQAFYGRNLFPRASSDAVAASMVANAIGAANSWILQGSVGAADAMKQAMFSNMWRDAGVQIPAMIGDPARASEVTALMSSAQAARQADGSNSAIATLAQENLPHMRNWIEAMLYALFPIVVIMVILVSADAAKKILAGYAMSLAWIGLWPVLFAVINHLSMLYLRSKAAGLHLDSGVAFKLSDVFDATLQDEQAAIGWMCAAVPFIAAAIVKMGQGGLAAAAEKFQGTWAGAAQTAGAAMASGNVSVGQVGLDNYTLNNTSMNAFDSSLRMSSGASAIQAANGDVVRTSAGGTVAIEQFANRMRMGMTVSDSSDAYTCRGYNAGQTVSGGTQVTRGHTDYSRLDINAGHNNAAGFNQRSETSSGVTVAGGFARGTGSGLRVTNQNSMNSGFEQNAGAGDTFGAGVGVQRGVPRVAGGGVTGPGAGVRQPGAEVAGGAAPAGRPGAAGPGGRGAFVTPSLQAQTNKTYGATQSRQWGAGSTAGDSEDTSKRLSYDINAQRGRSGGRGMSSSQTDSEGKVAAKGTSDDRTEAHNAVRGWDQRLDDSAGNRHSNTFTITHDMMTDPAFIKSVASRHGMTVQRFMAQERDIVFEQMSTYMAEKGVGSTAREMPAATMTGQAVPDSGALDKRFDGEKAKLALNKDALHRRNVRYSGFRSAAPIKVNVSGDPLIDAARNAVESNANPDIGDSLPSRAAPLRHQATMYASPDLAVGAGRARPMAMVEQAEKDDLVDTASSVGNAAIDFGNRVKDAVFGTKTAPRSPQYTEAEKSTKQVVPPLRR